MNPAQAVPFVNGDTPYVNGDSIHANGDSSYVSEDFLVKVTDDQGKMLGDPTGDGPMRADFPGHE